MFSFILGLGASLGLVGVALRRPGKDLRYLDAGLSALLGALLGGRLAYVAVHSGYYAAHLNESWQIWLGGMSAGGALLGAVLALVIYARLARRTLGRLADTLLPLAAAVMVSGWLACWLGGYAYGPVTNAWWGMPGQDEWGLLDRRWPVQLAGALLTLALFSLIDGFFADRYPRLKLFGSRRTPAGLPAGLALLGSGLIFFGLAFVRADPGLAWNGWRLEAWAGLAVAALALIWVSGLIGSTWKRGSL